MKTNAWERLNTARRDLDKAAEHVEKLEREYWSRVDALPKHEAHKPAFKVTRILKEN